MGISFDDQHAHSLDPNASGDAVAAIVNPGAVHYTIGMRGFYLAVLFALWLFGPTWMLIAS